MCPSDVVDAINKQKKRKSTGDGGVQSQSMVVEDWQRIFEYHA